MIVISNGNVVGDNLWLWRADHSGSGPITYDNACSHGLVVDGDNVTMYGLAVSYREGLDRMERQQRRDILLPVRASYGVTSSSIAITLAIVGSSVATTAHLVLEYTLSRDYG